MRAKISACGRFRYMLERDIGTATPSKLVVLFIGVNPSTADAETNDHTVTKLIGFATRWRMGQLLIGNLFAYRATDVKQLAAVPVANHPFEHGTNDMHLELMIQRAGLLVPMWGDLGKLPPALRPRADRVFDMLVDSGKPMMHFGLTKAGDPKHPLMLPYSTVLQDFPK